MNKCKRIFSVLQQKENLDIVLDTIKNNGSRQGVVSSIHILNGVIANMNDDSAEFEDPEEMNVQNLKFNL